MKYRCVFDGYRLRFVDQAQRTLSSCEFLGAAPARVGIPVPHTVIVRIRAPLERR